MVREGGECRVAFGTEKVKKTIKDSSDVGVTSITYLRVVRSLKRSRCG